MEEEILALQSAIELFQVNQASQIAGIDEVIGRLDTMSTIIETKNLPLAQKNTLLAKIALIVIDANTFKALAIDVAALTIVIDVVDGL